MIPKIIHYCWFGSKRKPKVIRDCIKSWKKHLSGYQIIEWNETNCNLSHPFLKDAFANKKWAFVSDYIRLEKIIEYGGVYLDTDMMVIKNLDVFLKQECFFGAEDLQFISCGIIGATPQHKFIIACKDEYEILDLKKIKNLGDITIPRLVTRKFRSIYNFKDDFTTITTKENLRIYPLSYFYPLTYENRKEIKNYKKYIRDETYAIHLWNSSWIEYSEFHYFKDKEYFKAFCKTIKYLYNSKEFNYAYLKSIILAIKESIK